MRRTKGRKDYCRKGRDAGEADHGAAIGRSRVVDAARRLCAGEMVSSNSSTDFKPLDQAEVRRCCGRT